MKTVLRLRAVVWLTLAVIVSVPLLWTGTGHSGVEEEIANLRAELAGIKKDLGEIKAILLGAVQRREPSNVTAEVSVSGKPSLGQESAPVTIVEFSDYQCPYCQRHFSTVFPILKKDYIDTGKVKYVYRDFPIANLHPQAKKGHEAAHCAGEQSKYWEMHDTLFQNSKDFSVSALNRYARAIGLDGDRFSSCLQSGKYANRIEREIAEGAKAGVQGTPTFFIGRIGTGDTITGTMVNGAQPVARFRQVIESILKAASSSQSLKSTP